MQAAKQLGGGLLIGLISLVVVVGGISLALAEAYVPQPPFFLTTETPAEFATSDLVVGTLDFLLSPWPTDTALVTATPISTDTPLPPTNCPVPAGWNRIVIAPGETIEIIAARYQTSVEILMSGNCMISTTLLPDRDLYVPPTPTSTVAAVSCGAPAGWVKYTVQPGDTLFHISQLYRTTVSELQRANCLGSSTTILAGQSLWVPNVPTSTPAITATILTIEFDTATVAPSATPIPTNVTEPTATAEPTSTQPAPSDTPPPTSP